MNVLIPLLLFALIGLLFYVSRMLFLAAGTPGGNFDAPSDSDDLVSLADATSSANQHNSSEPSHHSDHSSHSHDSGSFDGSGHSHH